MFFIASFRLLSAEPQNICTIEDQECSQISIRKITIYEDDSHPDFGVVISWGLEKPTDLTFLISKGNQDPETAGALVMTRLLLVEDMQREKGADPFSTPEKLVGWISSFVVDKSLKNRIYIASREMGITNLQNLIKVHPTKYKDTD